MRCNIITQREAEARRSERTAPCWPIKIRYRRVLAIVAICFALALIAGSIYLHLQQKHHLGRLHHQYSSPRTDKSDKDWNQLLPTMSGVAASSIETGSIESYDSYYDAFNEANTHDDKGDGNIGDGDAAQQPDKNQPSIETTTRPQPVKFTFAAATHVLSAECLQCMCEVTTECKPANCRDGPCGPYRISRPYWLDAMLNEPLGYERCVTNAECAQRVVCAYVHKYAQDCNNDRIIDCRDYIALHLLGPRGCRESQLPPVFELRMNRCFMNNNIFFN